MRADMIKNATLAAYSGYIEDEIQPVFHLLMEYLTEKVAHEAFFRKYASKKFMKGEIFPMTLWNICMLTAFISFHPRARLGQTSPVSLS